MCQLNLYCVKKELDEQRVLKLINDNFQCSIAQKITDEQPIVGLDPNFDVYIAAGMRCNCGSVLAGYQNGEGQTFDEYMGLQNSSSLDNLFAVRDLMESEGYQERLAKFEEKRAELVGVMTAYDEKIGLIERQLTDEVMSRDDIDARQKNALMHEKVYPQVQSLMQQNESRPEVVAARKRYAEFICDNRLMFDSSMYQLEKPDNLTVRAVPVSTAIKEQYPELYGENSGENSGENGGDGADAEEEPVFFDIPSNCIYDAIENASKNLQKQKAEEEYYNIRRLIESVLAESDQIKLFAYWQDGSEVIVEAKKTVNLSDLTIEDVAYLKYNTLLTVTR